MGFPENLRYTTTHEWVLVENDVATVGITDYAVEQLSDLVFIELASQDTDVTKDGRFGEIESTKTVSDLRAPVSGRIVQVNSQLVDNLDLVTESAYEMGWMVKIQMSDPAELENLLTAEDYQRHIESEEH